ncbi:hypothetical protein [Streptomyces sp. NPDC018059]|uniref:hypothetical protein n=1 Tax=Streptomyces sp. NPDC018059 TaxID=3365041 RepID=UPI003791B852
MGRTTAYDAVGNVTRRTDADRHVTPTATTRAGNLSQRTDANGNLAEKITPRGSTTHT